MVNQLIKSIDPSEKISNQLIVGIAKMNQDEAIKLYNDLCALIEFKNKNSGKCAFSRGIDPCNLLQQFWQRKSDACPLEAAKAESEENDFHDWVLDKYEQL